MRKILLIGLLLAAGSRAPGEIIDRIVVVVGRQIVTQSDLALEARLEAFFRNTPPPELRPGSPEAVTLRERLIRQRLVEQDMRQSTFPPAEPTLILEWLARMRPAGADPSRYGLAEDDLEDYARRQIDVERFIDQRFKPGLQIPDADIAAYYESTLLPELQRRGLAERPTLEQARGQIEAVLLEERVNQSLDQWLVEARSRAGVRELETPEP
jgi:hypothetical protein